MDANKLATIFEAYSGRMTPRVMSDSGWECGPTDIGGIYYSEKANVIVLTQGILLNGDAEYARSAIHRNVEEYNLRYHVDDFEAIEEGVDN